LNSAISVSAAQTGQFDRIVALLEEARLATRDLTPASINGFLVVVDEGQVIAAVALEQFENVGLLRSLVVAPAHRGKGLGEAMVQALEEQARARGVTSLALLTETAKDFFRARGYQVRERTKAPAGVQASSEFAFVCPASAVYMEKRLR
jgi:amino-acid N-acetyltransferase